MASRKPWDDAYYERNKEAINAKKAARYAKNREEIRAKQAEYYQRRKEYFAHKCSKRYASETQKTPSWLTKAHIVEMQGIYEFCKIFNGFISDPASRLQVDHMVPLSGKTVSGLHVPWNLQVLTSRKNASKYNNLHEDIL